MPLPSKILKEEKGQTLVVVFMLMILALTVGMGVAARYIKNLKQLERTDFSSRALGIAEAAVERLLVLPYETLEDYITYNSCGSNCALEITGEDGVLAEAVVHLSFIGNTTQPFPVDLTTADTKEINMLGYGDNESIYVCWNNPTSGEYPSVTGSLLYGSPGSYESEPFAYNSLSSLHFENGFDEAVSMFGYDSCFTVNGQTSPQALRLKSVYSSVTVYIIPSSGSEVPSQGILIESEGTVVNTTKKVTVVRAKPYLPTEFDYVLYSKSDSQPLAN